MPNTAARLDEVDPIDLLTELRSDEFNEDVNKLALALGREPDEVTDWINGDEIIDDDAAMKIRGLYQERLGDDSDYEDGDDESDDDNDDDDDDNDTDDDDGTSDEDDDEH